MSANNTPWDAAEGDPPSVLDGARRHWPHYTQATLTISVSWDYELDVTFPSVPNEEDPEIIECEEQNRTNTWTASLTGTLEWLRQDEADETFGADVPPGRFVGTFDRMGATETFADPDLPSIIAHLFTLATSSAYLTGTASRTIYFGDACDVQSDTDSGTIQLNANPGLIGILEDGFGRWFKYREGNPTPLAVFVIDGPGVPNDPPAIPAQALEEIANAPAGTPITFTHTATTTVPDEGSWHGTTSLTFSLTVAT